MDDRVSANIVSGLEVENAFRDREAHLLEEIDGDAIWCKRYSRKHMLWHRCLGMLVLICSVLAPVTVSSTLGKMGNEALFWGINIGYIAIGMTVILALAECIRRFFRFEQMWVSACLTSDALNRLKNHYQDQQVGLAVGSDQWVQNFRRLRTEKDAVMERDAKDFFHTVLSEASKLAGASAAKTPRRGR